MVSHQMLWPSGYHSSFIFEKSRIQILVRRQIIPTESFCGFPQSLQADAWTDSELGHNRFLAHPNLSFIIIWHSVVQDTDIIAK
jgi:hypothetical protein